MRLAAGSLQRLALNKGRTPDARALAHGRSRLHPLASTNDGADPLTRRTILARVPFG